MGLLFYWFHDGDEYDRWGLFLRDQDDYWQAVCDLILIRFHYALNQVPAVLQQYKDDSCDQEQNG